nr:hypothetical protein [Tanacetum cinerariifolium]
MIGGNCGNQFRQYVRQNAGNLNGYNEVQNVGNQNQIGNGNLLVARAEGNAAGQNANQIRCYNCRGFGHYARNCTARPRRRDAAYLQTQLLIAQKEEAGIQLQAEEYDQMAAAADLDEIEEVNANCILMANLQQASSLGTQTDSTPVYDSDGSAENDNNVISKVTDVEQGGETVEQHPVNFEETRKMNNAKSDQVLSSLILDDSCISVRDFSLSLMCKVKDIIAMPNLYVILEKRDAEDDGSQSGDKVGYNDVERVSESSYMHNNDLLYDKNHNNIMPDKEKVLFEDPFNLYDILNKGKVSGDDLKYPHGFTPSVINVEEVNKKVKGATSNEVNEHVNSTSNKLEESVPKEKLSSNNSVCSKTVHTGGLILQFMEELVKELNDDTLAETLSDKDKGKGILVEDPKPMKQKYQIEMDAEYARKLQEEEESHVQAKNVQAKDVQAKDIQAKGIQYIRRYHGYKKKPQSESEACKNMIAYLKNTEGFKMAFFKGKTYDQIRLIFKARKVPVVNYEIVMINNKPSAVEVLMLLEESYCCQSNVNTARLELKLFRDVAAPAHMNGSDHEDANKHIEKVLEIVDLLYIPNITIDQVKLRAFPMSLTGSTSCWLRNKPSGWGYRVAALGFYQRNNMNPSYQEQRQSMEDTLKKFMSESEKRHEENSNLIKEIRASTDAAIKNQEALIKTLEIQIGQMIKVLQERGFGSLPSSTETNLRDHVKSISTIVEADTNSIRGMDIANITRKRPKPDKNGHENGKSSQEPGIIRKSQPKSTLVNIGQLTS